MLDVPFSCIAIAMPTIIQRLGFSDGMPIGLYIWWMQGRIEWSALIFLPCLTMYFLYLVIWRRLRGYTGDCCGALFLLTELTAYLVVSYYV